MVGAGLSVPTSQSATPARMGSSQRMVFVFIEGILYHLQGQGVQPPYSYASTSRIVIRSALRAGSKLDTIASTTTSTNHTTTAYDAKV